MTEQTHNKSYGFLIYSALIVSILIAFEPIRHNGFVTYDDPEYIMDNPNVNGGITGQSIIWAFTKFHSANWHPLTWLSHMLDCEIYGLNYPAGHHITSLLIHIANTLLLFYLLRKMTGAVWKSAFVAAVFALHPLHVESVAWASERKDVLSTLFWMLTILAYMRYAGQPNIKRYVIVLLAFAMGLMSKPMVVTLPFVLLLLDYWPLDRVVWRPAAGTSDTSAAYRKASAKYLVMEKIPMFVLSAASCVITFFAQKAGGAVVSMKNLALYARVIISLECYYNYIIKMFYPKGLTTLYTISEKMTVDSAVLVVGGAAVILYLWGRKRPWLVVGLLWYLGVLVPVIGLVKVGEQLMADRYTYIPMIGVVIIIAWGAEEIFSKMRNSKMILASAAAAAMIAMVFLTRAQVGYWRDDPTMYKRGIEVSKDNYTMMNNYGKYLYTQGKYDEAIRYFKESLRIYPGCEEARQNLCQTILAQGKFDEAIACITESLKERNDWPGMHIMYRELGWAYEQKGDPALAEINYNKALSLKPDYEPAMKGLSRALAKQGKAPQPPKAGINTQQN